MRAKDFSFRRDETGESYIVYAKGITKTRQNGLHQKSRLQLPKMFETQPEKCPVKLFQKYLSKCPVINPLTNIWYKKMPVGINSINSMMKDLISNSAL